MFAIVHEPIQWQALMSNHQDINYFSINNETFIINRNRRIGNFCLIDLWAFIVMRSNWLSYDNFAARRKMFR